MAKTTTIILLDNVGCRYAFEVEHAERMLRLSNSMWRLPDDSEYELTENGIRRKQTKKSVKGEE